MPGNSNSPWGLIVPGRPPTPSEGAAQTYHRVGPSGTQRTRTFENGTCLTFGPQDIVDEFNPYCHPFHEQIAQIDTIIRDCQAMRGRYEEIPGAAPDTEDKEEGEDFIAFTADDPFNGFRQSHIPQQDSLQVSMVHLSSGAYLQVPSKHASCSNLTSVYSTSNKSDFRGILHPGHTNDTRFGVTSNPHAALQFPNGSDAGMVDRQTQTINSVQEKNSSGSGNVPNDHYRRIGSTTRNANTKLPMQNRRPFRPPAENRHQVDDDDAEEMFRQSLNDSRMNDDKFSLARVVPTGPKADRRKNHSRMNNTKELPRQANAHATELLAPLGTQEAKQPLIINRRGVDVQDLSGELHANQFHHMMKMMMAMEGAQIIDTEMELNIRCVNNNTNPFCLLVGHVQLLETSTVTYSASVYPPSHIQAAQVLPDMNGSHMVPPYVQQVPGHPDMDMRQAPLMFGQWITPQALIEDIHRNNPNGMHSRPRSPLQEPVTGHNYEVYPGQFHSIPDLQPPAPPQIRHNLEALMLAQPWPERPNVVSAQIAAQSRFQQEADAQYAQMLDEQNALSRKIGEVPLRGDIMSGEDLVQARYGIMGDPRVSHQPSSWINSMPTQGPSYEQNFEQGERAQSMLRHGLQLQASLAAEKSRQEQIHRNIPQETQNIPRPLSAFPEYPLNTTELNQATDALELRKSENFGLYIAQENLRVQSTPKGFPPGHPSNICEVNLARLALVEQRRSENFRGFQQIPSFKAADTVTSPEISLNLPRRPKMLSSPDRPVGMRVKSVASTADVSRSSSVPASSKGGFKAVGGWGRLEQHKIGRAQSLRKPAESRFKDFFKKQYPGGKEQAEGEDGGARGAAN